MHRNYFMVLAVIAATLVAACTLANIGTIKTSEEVTRQFETMQINPAYRYWYLNQENNPFGVIGLDREYGFDGGPLWRAVETDSVTLKKVVGLVQSFPVPGSYTSGFNIFDHEGRQIGVWYSSIGAGITVDPATKVVSVATKTPWRTP
jgi:hypothetical protein